VADGYGRPPDVEEVHARRACLLTAQWLLKVTRYAWDSGIAPAEWKSAVIAPSYKGKDPRDAAGSCRGIGLLSIAGKVYARLLLHSTVEQIEP